MEVHVTLTRKEITCTHTHIYGRAECDTWIHLNSCRRIQFLRRERYCTSASLSLYIYIYIYIYSDRKSKKRRMNKEHQSISLLIYLCIYQCVNLMSRKFPYLYFQLLAPGLSALRHWVVSFFTTKLLWRHRYNYNLYVCLPTDTQVNVLFTFCYWVKFSEHGHASLPSTNKVCEVSG